jgi:hypothetical protein
MALKRINKELTDLGRYVVPAKSEARPPLARQPATAGRRVANMAIRASTSPCGHVWLTCSTQ